MINNEKFSVILTPEHMTKKQNTPKDKSAEDKILEAARIVFMQKGYAATRTRDIAEEAGINLALLNYYFKSKENLFQIIMLEKMHKLFGTLVPVLNDTKLSLEEKLQLVAYNYIEMLTQNPDLPIFVLSEMRNNPEGFASKFQITTLIKEAHFVKQLREKRPDIHPLQFLLSILGMLLFPFVAMPVFTSGGLLDRTQFFALMEQRKVLVPQWINAILDVEPINTKHT